MGIPGSKRLGPRYAVLTFLTCLLGANAPVVHAGPIAFFYSVTGPSNLATFGPPGVVRVGTYTVDQDLFAAAIAGNTLAKVPLISFEMTTYFVGPGSLNYSGPAALASALTFPAGGTSFFSALFVPVGGTPQIFFAGIESGGNSLSCLSSTCAIIQGAFNNPVLGQFSADYVQTPIPEPATISLTTGAIVLLAFSRRLHR